MNIKFTNGNGDESEINIKGKCRITDYDTRMKNPSGNDLTVNVDNDTASIMNGTELQQDSQTVQMNANKYSVFTAIAAMDSDGSTFTEEDLARAKDTYNNGGENWNKLVSLGVTEIRYDSHAGVATIVIGDNELLRIDFKTWRERIGMRSDSTSQVPEDSGEAVEEEPEENTKKEVPKPTIEFYNITVPSLVDKISEQDEVTKKAEPITEEQLNEKISDIAERVGCSESLILRILASESFSRRVEDPGDKKPTGGFGHVLKDYDERKGLTWNSYVTNEQAFTWLEHDLNIMIEDVKKHLPNCDWEKIPKSIQGALIDLAYNGGPGKVTSKEAILLEAEETGSYIDAAVVISQIDENKASVKAGVMKRACYRFLCAIEDLPAQDRLDAMDRFDSENSYYTTTINLLSKGKNKEAAWLLAEDWLEARHAAEMELGLYEEPEGIKYVVQSGDNWWDIAKDHNIKMDELIEYNVCADGSNNFFAGRRIRIPVSESEQNQASV